MLVMLLLTWTNVGMTADKQRPSMGCLYSVTVGSEATPVLPCIDADPLKLAEDTDVRTVMQLFGIHLNKVRFKGCTNSRFSVTPDVKSEAGDQRYIVTYPIDIVQSYVAPITHELAHILQMEIAGGLDPLRDAFTSKRVELGADFLAGIVFSNSLLHIDINRFQHNLSLMGQYVELDVDAHGSPSQRNAAFRTGAYWNFDAWNRDIRRVNNEFQQNHYGKI